MQIEQIGFVVLTFLACGYVATELHGWIAKIGMIVIVLGVMFLGPSVLGRNWDQGFGAGLVLGGFADSVFMRDEKGA